MRINYAIVFVSDMERSVAFYRDVIGLTLKYQTPYWSEFVTEGATLALHWSEGQAATGPVPDGSPGSCRPGFAVPDLDAFHARMKSHEVPCVQEPRSVFGTRIAQYRDPDGLVISVGEVTPNAP